MIGENCAGGDFLPLDQVQLAESLVRNVMIYIDVGLSQGFERFTGALEIGAVDRDKSVKRFLDARLYLIRALQVPEGSGKAVGQNHLHFFARRSEEPIP